MSRRAKCSIIFPRNQSLARYYGVREQTGNIRRTAADSNRTSRRKLHTQPLSRRCICARSRACWRREEKGPGKRMTTMEEAGVQELPARRVRTFFGEPIGLAYLSFTEAWE